MESLLGKQLGSGGTANVYAWSDTQVIKIYKPHVTDDIIDNERYIGELLNTYSLDIPYFNGSVEYNGKEALLYERINGRIMAEPLFDGRCEKDAAYAFAKMHYDIHQKVIDVLPSQYEFLKNRILELRDILGDKTVHLLNLLNSIPIENRLCHGDFQPLNIIDDSDKYVVIDWNGACSGNPILGVAWSYITLNSPVISHVLGEFVSETFADFAKEYLTYYCHLTGIKEEQILNCLPITAARRLYDDNLRDDDISKQEREWLMNFISSVIM